MRRPVGPIESEPFDLVVFWKQNDSGIYGRRSDLLVAEVARSDSVAHTIQFDAPISASRLIQLSRPDPDGERTHNRMVHEATMRRVRGEAHDEHISRYTFVYDDRPDASGRWTRPDEFGDFVAEVLDRHRVGERDVAFWVYPTLADAPDLIDRFRPAVVVADVVDDNRTWFAAGSEQHMRLTANYAATFARSDVIIANCGGVRDAMCEFDVDIEIIANACEPVRPASRRRPKPPHELAAVTGPIIGYVGNLSSRIDVALIAHLAEARPDCHVVLIGSTHAGHDVLELTRFPNVAILGPRRLDEAKRYIAAFDVAIIPHLDNDMTRAMQPLKAFVYCSMGVPVVSTSVANIDGLSELIVIAETHDEFVEAVAAALRRGRRRSSARLRQIVDENSWPVRARQVLQLIERIRQRAAGPGKGLSGPRCGGR